MVERSQDLDLAREALADLLALGHVGLKLLMRPRVLTFGILVAAARVDEAKPAPPELLSQLPTRHEEEASRAGLWSRRRRGRSSLAVVTNVRRSDTQLTGSAGEFLVAGELARCKWVPSVTPRGIERTDILAQHAETAAVIAVQVKTANPKNPFRLSPKAERPAQQWNQWYVFVSLRDLNERPRYYIVPTNVVAALIYVGHRAWLKGTKRDGSARRDSSVRAAQLAEVAAYEDAWELLAAPADQAPVHLPAWVFERGEGDVGWPDGHPGFAVHQAPPATMVAV